MYDNFFLMVQGRILPWGAFMDLQKQIIVTLPGSHIALPQLLTGSSRSEGKGKKKSSYRKC